MEIEFKLFDSLTENLKILSLSCKKGILKSIENRDCEIKVEMTLADFTTMLFSQQAFCTFIETGLAKINRDKYFAGVNKLFLFDTIPFNI